MTTLVDEHTWWRAPGSAASELDYVAAVNSLEIVQPGAIACPSFPVDATVVTFEFRANDGGTVLASASELAFATEPTTACDSMAFSVRGHSQMPLLGGAAVIRKASRLLGVHLQTAPPRAPRIATGATLGRTH